MATNDITLDDLMGSPPAASKQKPITFDDVMRDTAFPEPKDPAVASAEQQGLVPFSHPVTRDPIQTPKDSRGFPVFKSMLVDDPETKRKIVADSMFPGDPNGASRVGIVGGRMVVVNDNGQLEYVADKWGEFGANLGANAPEIAGATIGAFSGQPVLGSTLGAMGGDAWKRVLANSVFGEPQTSMGNVKGIATEGALNLVTAGAAKGVTKAIDRGRVVNFGPKDQAAALATQAKVKQRFGIDLNLAQASGDPRVIQMWRYLANYPGKSAEIASVANELQAGQVDNAVQQFIALTGKGLPSSTLGKQAIEVSQQTIRAARQKLSDEVRPLYDAAYAAVPEVTDRNILRFLKLPYFQDAYDAGQKIAKLEGKAAPSVMPEPKMVRVKGNNGIYRFEPEKAGGHHGGPKPIPKPDLRSLDYTKRALDDKIESLKAAGNRQEARALKMKRDEFVEALDALPNQQWQAARQAYQAGMKSTVEPLENGVVGFLSKIKDPKAATIASKVFTDPNITAREILQAKGAILSQEGGKEAWDGLTRQWLAQAWNRANKVTQVGEARNASGKFAQTVAGTPTDKAKLVAALGQERGELASDLIDVLSQVASTSGMNSDTAFMQEIGRSFRGAVAQGLKTVTSPRAAVQEAAERRAIESNTTRVAEALTDPRKVAQLRVVVKMPASAKRNALLLSLLSLDVGKAAAGDQTSADQLPPGYQPR